VASVNSDAQTWIRAYQISRTQNFRSEGCRRLHPRSRNGASVLVPVAPVLTPRFLRMRFLLPIDGCPGRARYQRSKNEGAPAIGLR
jgi:hypothetical protein